MSNRSNHRSNQQRRNMNQKQSYQYGNTAYQLQPEQTDWQEQQKRPQRPKRPTEVAPQRQRQTDARVQSRPKQRLYIKSTKEAIIHNFIVVIGVLMIFGAVVMALVTQVMIKGIEVDIRQDMQTLETLKQQNTALELEMMETMDITYIKEEAKERFNMAEPQPYQIITIDVPKQSYTIQHDN